MSETSSAPAPLITPSELFDVRVPRGLEANPERVKEFKLILQFNVSGDNGGTWTVDTIQEPARCYQGAGDNAQCVIQITASALMELLATEPIGRPQVVMKFILDGDIEVEGDVTQAMKLSRVFSIADAGT